MGLWLAYPFGHSTNLSHGHQGCSSEYAQIAPHLVVRDGRRALRFYQEAFQAEVTYLSEMPGGIGLHAQLRVADSFVLVSTENI